MKEAQQVVAEKTGTLEAESYKTKRLHVSHHDLLSITAILQAPTPKGSLEMLQCSP